MLTAAIATSDPNSSAQLLASIEQSGLVGSIKTWTVPTEKMPDSAEQLPDIVFLDLSLYPETFFTFGAQLRRIRPATRIIACSATVPPSPQLLLEAMRSGVQDFLAKPVEPKALKEILSRIVQECEQSDRPSFNKLIVIMGSKGGVGSTTVAVNLGVKIATYAKKRAAVLDFARPLGNVHLQPAMGVQVEQQVNVAQRVRKIKHRGALLRVGRYLASEVYRHGCRTDSTFRAHNYNQLVEGGTITLFAFLNYPRQDLL